MFLTPLLDQMLDRVREPDSSANPVTISRVYSDIYHFYVRIPNFLAGDGGLKTGDRHGGTGGVECVFTEGRSSARFGRDRARSPAAVSAVPSPACPVPGRTAPQRTAACSSAGCAPRLLGGAGRRRASGADPGRWTGPVALLVRAALGDAAVREIAG